MFFCCKSYCFMFLKRPDLAGDEVCTVPWAVRHALSCRLNNRPTGHVAVNRHLKLVGVKDSSICPLCSEEEEMALHF